MTNSRLVSVLLVGLTGLMLAAFATHATSNVTVIKLVGLSVAGLCMGFLFAAADAGVAADG